MGEDFNSRSTVWFQAVNGSSNIDLTLCTANCSHLIQGCKVVDGLNTADHRPITFSVGVQTHGPPAENRERVNNRLDFENITVDQIGAEMA
jgi:hypothetical protein